MARRLAVVISQGQSAHPAKRQLEEDLVAGLLGLPGIEVTVVPHLYDLSADGTGMLCLQGITGDLVVLSWLYPRAALWVLDRNGIHGQMGQTLLKGNEEEESDEDEDDLEPNAADQAADTAAARGDSANGRSAGNGTPHRKIYGLDLRWQPSAAPYVAEIRRIQAESSVQTVGLLGWIQGSPQPQALDRFLHPAPGNVASDSLPSLPLASPATSAAPPSDVGQSWNSTENNSSGAAETASGQDAGSATVRRIEEEAPRRWYPVIDFSRCTNCMECLDFCLFGVYGVDVRETILVEQPDNCRKGCPACSRVCPENAIIFPQHKSPAIAGSPDGVAGGFKIDLSKLFGAPDAMEQAVLERDSELVAAGRDAVGSTIGMPKRQDGRSTAPQDDLDRLMDQLDHLDL